MKHTFEIALSILGIIARPRHGYRNSIVFLYLTKRQKSFCSTWKKDKAKTNNAYALKPAGFPGRDDVYHHRVHRRSRPRAVHHLAAQGQPECRRCSWGLIIFMLCGIMLRFPVCRHTRYFSTSPQASWHLREEPKLKMSKALRSENFHRIIQTRSRIRQHKQTTRTAGSSFRRRIPACQYLLQLTATCSNRAPRFLPGTVRNPAPPCSRCRPP